MNISRIDSWQNVLRRQYQRRDPEASPIGLLVRSQYSIVESSRASTAPPGALSEVSLDEAKCENESLELDRSTAPSPGNLVSTEGSVEDPRHLSPAKVEEEEDSLQALEAPEKRLDWLDLSMLAKLESLHTLAEWQFQNPHRLRQQMKDDDEQATWVCRSTGTFHPLPPDGLLVLEHSESNPLGTMPKGMHTGLLAVCSCGIC